jgi:hypothetical protein
MRVWPLFSAPHVYQSDSARQHPIRAGMRGLRHKSRHKIPRRRVRRAERARIAVWLLFDSYCSGAWGQTAPSGARGPAPRRSAKARRAGGCRCGCLRLRRAKRKEGGAQADALGWCPTRT